MFNELLTLAFHNLMRARVRLVMTSGGVLVGTTAIILLIALTIGLQRSAEEGIGRSASLLQIQVTQSFGGRSGGGNRPTLNNEALRQIQNLEGVKFVVPIIELNNVGNIEVDNLQAYASVIGINPRHLQYLGIEGKIGNDQAIAGKNVGRTFYDPESEDFSITQVNLSGRLLDMQIYSGNTPNIQPISITSVLQGNTFADDIIMAQASVVALNQQYQSNDQNSSNNAGNGNEVVYSRLIVQSTDRNKTLGVTDAIRNLGFMTSGAGDTLAQINSFFSMMRLALGGIGGVALLVAAFGVANTMIMAILERTREIGLMKAIGATDGEVMTIFIMESALVGLIGGVSGVLVSFALQDILNKAITNFARAQQSAQAGSAASMNGSMMPINLGNLSGNLIVIPIELVAFALVLATLVGVGAGIYPAMRASRMLTVVALKTD